MTQIDHSTLQHKLPKDYAKKLSKQFKCSIRYVQFVVKGERQNVDILLSAVELANNHQEFLKSLNQKIKTI